MGDWPRACWEGLSLVPSGMKLCLHKETNEILVMLKPDGSGLAPGMLGRSSVYPLQYDYHTAQLFMECLVSLTKFINMRLMSDKQFMIGIHTVGAESLSFFSAKL